MRQLLASLATALLGVSIAFSQSAPAPAGSLQVFFIDVEGGQATLFVAPGHHSLLIDTGWPGNEGRDADRIVAAAHQAGLTRIENVLITHYHQDHVGGLPQLAARIPIGTVIDHGVNREDTEPATHAGYVAYQQLLAGPKPPRHLVARLGQPLPVQGMLVEVVSVDGQVLPRALTDAGAGAGKPNPACAQSETRPADQTENARSLGVVIHFGKTTLVDLGDLTWDKERLLMCPVNLLGHADVYIASHHGWEQSGSPALVHGLSPRLAIMDNGATKGGSPGPWKTITETPGLAALWQLHEAEGAGSSNVPSERLANLKGGAEGNSLELTVAPDGALTMRNARTGKSQTYAQVETEQHQGGN